MRNMQIKTESQCSEINYYFVLNYAVFHVFIVNLKKMSLFLIIRKCHYFIWKS